MEQQNTKTTIPTFLIPAPSAMLPHPTLHKSLHVLPPTRTLCPKHATIMVHHRIKEQLIITTIKDHTNNLLKQEQEQEQEEGCDTDEIQKRIHALQRILPNGESITVDNLFDETASYIMALQSQLKALRNLSAFFDNLEKEKTKLGA